MLPSFASLGSKDVGTRTKLNLSYYFIERETGIWRGRRDCSSDKQQTPQCPPRTDEVADKGSSWRRGRKKKHALSQGNLSILPAVELQMSQLFDPQLAHV